MTALTTTRSARTAEPITVLLVEDDAGDAKAIRRAFDKAKITHRIERCIDGVEALQFLEAQLAGDGHPIERRFIMLVDVNLPRLSGHGLIARIRQHPDLRKLIAFMLTTSADPSDIDAAYANNVAGYIVKDSSDHDFLPVVQMLDSYWHTVEVPALRGEVR